MMISTIGYKNLFSSSCVRTAAPRLVILTLLLVLLLQDNKQSTSHGLPDIADPENVHHWPAEDEPHEATWLQWPHNFGWSRNHIQRYEPSWIELVKALHTGEQVRIIAYDRGEKRRIRNVLKANGIDMSKIDIYRYPTDDVWVRDNGPIFVFNERGGLIVQDWGFNGWGRKADWWYDDYIPKDVSWELNVPLEVVQMVNEGGSIETDGRGTLMAKKSSILNRNRNPGATQEEVESYFRRYLGVTNFIWLDGTPGLDITDDHIDGTARFANGDTIVTHYKKDFLEPDEYDVLVDAVDADGKEYNIVHLPITEEKIDNDIGYGIYINYYVANDVVIVPKFYDVNDSKAAQVLKDLYPTKEVIGIDFTELYVDGGLVHCVTMQQPAAI